MHLEDTERLVRDGNAQGCIAFGGKQKSSSTIIIPSFDHLRPQQRILKLRAAPNIRNGIIIFYTRRTKQARGSPVL